jgi:AcrR family transcriptional regulator
MAADRPPRADARRNRERVLRAATEAFAESGIDVPLDEIAARAGVGPGTVYRHFPTKEALFQAVVTGRIDDLVEEARRLAEQPDAGGAFFAFLGRIRGEAAAKRDTPDALSVPGARQAELHEAMQVLLTRAQAAGAVRAGIDVGDLVAMVKGLVGAVRGTADPGRVDRLFAIVVDGLSARG